ncbi:hypothetical protein [Paenibacillus protaetiae]|nr:hypothetical protein [Paenibacillus protaetiae]
MSGKRTDKEKKLAEISKLLFFMTSASGGKLEEGSAAYRVIA